MVEWPAGEQITLGDLREANRLLVECGATIGEINAVRRTFSAVKGGALARRALQASMITLIVSDTNRGDEASVASGPTLSPPTNGPDPHEVLIRYQLEAALPQLYYSDDKTEKPIRTAITKDKLALRDP